MAPQVTPTRAAAVKAGGAPSNGDTALFLGVIRRQAAALAEIVERYGREVRAEASRSTGGQGADAVVHQVFDELWRTPHLYDSASGDLLAHLLDRTRMWAVQAAPSGVSDVAMPDVFTMLAAMPAHQRDAIVLARRDGFTYREVAAVLGRSESSVQRDLREGLAHLRRQMTAGTPTGG